MKILKIMMIFIFIIIVIWILPTIIINDTNKEIVKKAYLKNTEESGIMKYNIIDLVKVLEIDDSYIINTNLTNDITYDKYVNFKINIKNFSGESHYIIQILKDNQQLFNGEILDQNYEIQLELVKEGKNSLDIKILKDNEEVYTETKKIYYVLPYERQFLDEFSQFGISTHFGLNSGNKDKIENAGDLLKSLGIKWIRDSIRWEKVQKR